MGTLINGIKEIFASASQTSPTNIPTCAADGTPNGNITIANLASVLGVQLIKGSNPSRDYNEVFTTGYYRASNNNGDTNLPNTTNGFFIEVIDLGSNRILQRATTTDINIPTALYSRVYSVSQWGNWTKEDAFGYNTLADLASALGVGKVKWYGGLSSPDDLRTQSDNELCAGSFHGISPFGTDWVTVFSISSFVQSYYCIQFAFKATTAMDNLYIRTYNNNQEWTTWKAFPLT